MLISIKGIIRYWTNASVCQNSNIDDITEAVTGYIHLWIPRVFGVLLYVSLTAVFHVSYMCLKGIPVFS